MRALPSRDPAPFEGPAPLRAGPPRPPAAAMPFDGTQRSLLSLAKVLRLGSASPLHTEDEALSSHAALLLQYVGARGSEADAPPAAGDPNPNEAAAPTGEAQERERDRTAPEPEVDARRAREAVAVLASFVVDAETMARTGVARAVRRCAKAANVLGDTTLEAAARRLLTRWKDEVLMSARNQRKRRSAAQGTRAPLVR